MTRRESGREMSWDVREEGRLTDGVSTSGVEAAITIATKENGEDED